MDPTVSAGFAVNEGVWMLWTVRIGFASSRNARIDADADRGWLLA